MANKESFKDLQSQTINFLRFPLVIGVLFIHNHVAKMTVLGVEYGSAAPLPIFYYCSNFFSAVLAHISVPLFFFIAGFLFFLNVDDFNRNVYGKKLHTRAKTLLVPYLFWNLSAIGICFILDAVLTPKGFVHNYGMRLQDVLPSLLCVGPVNTNQFWFIRDLMVMVILTPIIYFVCQKAKIYGVVLLGILWFFGWWFNQIGASIMAVFFFTAGACFSINKRNLIVDMSKIKRLSFALYPLLALADLFTKQYAFNTFINQTGIIVGIVFSFNFAAFLLKTGRAKATEFLSTASFFVYALHEPFWLRQFRGIAYMIFKPKTDIAITCLYFLIVILAIILALALYYMLRRFLPKFTAIITGGR